MEFVRELAAIGVVLGLLAVARWALGRYRTVELARHGQLRTAGRLRLSNQLVLHLVECDGARCLVTEQKSGCSVLLLPAAEDRQTNLRLSQAAGQRGVA